MFGDDPYKVFQDFGVFDGTLSRIGNAGYVLFLHTHNWRTKFIYSTYSEEWLRCYDRNNFLAIDPIVLWSLIHTGTTRWSEMTTKDGGPWGHVMTRARDFGMIYGAVAVTRSRYLENKKCMICIARNDRELTDEEINEVSQTLEKIVEQHDSRMGLSDVDVSTIQALAHGHSQEEIAHDMGISRDTVKKRIERIRKKIGARNATHIVSIALSNRLIETV